MPLRRLSSLERKKIDLEYRELTARIKKLEALLRSEVKIRNLISQEIVEIRTKYGDSRRTQIAGKKALGRVAGAPLTATDLASTKETWVVITADNRISRTPTQRLPRISGRIAPKLIIGATGRDTLYLFNKEGLASALAIHTLPEASDSKEGIPIPSVSAFSSNVEITTGIALPRQQIQHLFLTFATEKGMIKKTVLKEFPEPSTKTFQAVRVSKDDTLRWVRLTTGRDEILMVSRLGMAIRFSEKHVRPMGLVAAGVNGMKLDGPEDRIVAMDVIKPRGDVLLLSDRGFAKRSAQSQYPVQGRYGKGVLAWKSGENVHLVGAAIGLAEQRATAFLQRAAARSVRIGDAVRRNRAAVGNPIFPVKDNDQVLTLTPVIPLPSLPSPPKKRRPRKQSTSKRSPTSSRKTKTSSKITSSQSTRAKSQSKKRTSTTKTSTSRRKTGTSRSSKGSK